MIVLKHILGQAATTGPRVTDSAGALVGALRASIGDDLTLGLQSRQIIADGSEAAYVMTGATLLHCTLRAAASPASKIYGRQTSPFTSDATIYDLAAGKVAFRINVGLAGWTITAVNTGSKRFTVQGPVPVGQFAGSQVFTVSGSTGNDGTYTIASVAGNVITVVEAVPSSVADGTIYHNALDYASAAGGNVSGFASIEIVTAAGDNLAVLPAFSCVFRGQLDSETTSALPGPPGGTGSAVRVVTGDEYTVADSDGYLYVDLDTASNRACNSYGTHTITLASAPPATWTAGRKVVVYGSTHNDGTYTIVSVLGAVVTVTETVTNTGDTNGTAYLCPTIQLPALASQLPARQVEITVIGGGSDDSGRFARVKAHAGDYMAASEDDLTSTTYLDLVGLGTGSMGDSLQLMAIPTLGIWRERP